MIAIAPSRAAAQDDPVVAIPRFGISLEYLYFGEHAPGDLRIDEIGGGFFAGVELDFMKLFHIFYPELDFEVATTLSSSPLSSSLTTTGGSLLLKYGEGADQLYLSIGGGRYNYSSDVSVPAKPDLERRGSGNYLRLGAGVEFYLTGKLFVRFSIQYTRGFPGDNGLAWEGRQATFAVGILLPIT
ncbi:MAG: outer membrane beta-barrel protein [Planctomycetota bacterium]|nr:outer membrane beta-barrel protein [Planctomycetota bacterium]